MKVTVTVLGATLELEVANEREAIKRLAFYQALPPVCPVCESATRFSYREPEGYEYYGLVCEQGHEYKFGIHNNSEKTLFPKGEWTHYDGKQEQVLHRAGRPTLAGADADAAVAQATEDEGRKLMSVSDADRMKQEVVARKIMDDLGISLYGNTWTNVRTQNIERMTNGQATSPSELSLAELNKMVEGLKILQQRRAQGVKA